MNTIGIYISNTIEKGFRWLKFRRFGRDDVMSAYLGAGFGEDYSPTKGTRLIQIPTANSTENIVISVVKKADSTLLEGEKVVYSTDQNDNVKCQIYLRSNGKIEVKGGNIVLLDGNDFAVRFSGLQSEFNELNNKYNDLVAKWNLFAAAYVPGGPGTQGLPPTASTGSASTANIVNARVDTIKLP
jgi:hypothetical protein